MFSTTNNRNRKGQFTHEDREHKPAAERAAYQAGVADLMQRNSERPFDIHALAPTFAELAAVEGAKAIVMVRKGNAYAARILATEAAHIARLEAK